jgi:hypothetical protein
MDLFSGALSLYISCVLVLRPSALFNEMNYLSKKKKKSRETIDHLLLNCDVTKNLWELIFRLFGIE